MQPRNTPLDGGYFQTWVVDADTLLFRSPNQRESEEQQNRDTVVPRQTWMIRLAAEQKISKRTHMIDVQIEIGICMKRKECLR